MQFFEQSLSEICKENDITATKFCDGYCYKLSKNNKSMFIYNNVFENNGASIYKILKDKSAVFEILTANSIPSVEHYYISPLDTASSVEAELSSFFKKYGKLVLKHNEGMSGTNVFYVDNYNDLITISNKIIDQFGAVSLSPFYDIKHEYRIVVLNNKVELVYDKIRPTVVGNGKDTLSQLIRANYPNLKTFDKNLNLQSVPAKNEQIILSWRHNLNFGSTPKIIDDKVIIKKLSKIALSAAKTLNINYACIDIIETNSNELKVLEINGSVSMGKFASFSKQNYQTAKGIIQKAILSKFS